MLLVVIEKQTPVVGLLAAQIPVMVVMGLVVTEELQAQAALV